MQCVGSDKVIIKSLEEGGIDFKPDDNLHRRDGGVPIQSNLYCKIHCCQDATEITRNIFTCDKMKLRASRDGYQ